MQQYVLSTCAADPLFATERPGTQVIPPKAPAEEQSAGALLCKIRIATNAQKERKDRSVAKRSNSIEDGRDILPQSAQRAQKRFLTGHLLLSVLSAISVAEKFSGLRVRN